MSYLTTRKGDTGTTCIGGGRVSKTHPLIRLVGLLDCLQSEIGMLDNYSIEYPYLKKHISDICNDLYTIMGMVHKTCPGYLTNDDMKPFLERLDSIIADIKLPKMNQFIRPTAKFSIANNARANCRLYENMILHIEVELDAEDKCISQYLNRMSSVIYGFMIYINNTRSAKKAYIEIDIDTGNLMYIVAGCVGLTLCYFYLF